MDLEKQAKKVANQLWNISNMGNVKSAIDVLEHLSFLLYLRFSKAKFYNYENQSEWTTLINESRFEPTENIMNIYQRILIEHPYVNELDGEIFRGLEKTALLFEPNVFVEIIKYIEYAFPDNEYSLNESWYGQVLESLIIKTSSYGTVLIPKFLAETMGRMLLSKHNIQSFPIRICDPACGTGSLLISAFQHLCNYPDEFNYFTGYEVNTSISRISQINLFFHGLKTSKVRNIDGLSLKEEEGESYDFILLNPPLGLTVDSYTLPKWYEMTEVENKKNNGIYHYINLTLSLLSFNGKCAIIIPEGLLFSTSSSQVHFRRRLLDKARVDGIVSLPSGFFSNTSIKTSLVFMTKCAPSSSINNKIWFYEFDESSSHLRNSEIPWRKLYEAWEQYQFNQYIPELEYSNAWVTSFKQIEQNDFVLSASHYRLPLKNSVLPDIDPEETFTQLMEIEKSIMHDMEELDRLRNIKLPETNLNEYSTSTDREQIVSAVASLDNVKKILSPHFSKKQQALFNVYMDSDVPLACHEATKKANSLYNKRLERLDVQEAQQMTVLFESLGLIEPVSSGEMYYPKQSSNDPSQIISLKDPVTIVLWKRSEQLGR